MLLEFDDFIADLFFSGKKENYSKKFSPHILLFIFHYCEMLEIHGNIHMFATQPNEKLNDFCTKYYQNCSNKQNSDKKYLIQLIKKRNRIEFYNLEGDVHEFFSNFYQEDSSENEIDESSDTSDYE